MQTGKKISIKSNKARVHHWINDQKEFAVSG